MLFINSYTKKELDKSGLSMIEYYTRLIEDINIGITEIRDYLVNMLDTVEELRARLYNIKDTIQKDLDTTKAAYANDGYTNSTLDTIQEILDGVEEDLEDVTEGITSTIEAIDAGDDSCEYNITETETPTCQHSETPFDEETCSYCTYTITDDGVFTDINEGCLYGEGSCSVCNHGDCLVDINNGTEYTGGIQWPEDGEVAVCGHTLDNGDYCLVSTSSDGTQSCEYTGTIPEGCTFECSHSSSCSNETITGCTYSCEDGIQGCNHEMCSQCNYTSEECGQEESTCDEFPCVVPEDCSHDSNDTSCGYDENCGFDYSSGEFVDQDDDDDDDTAEDCGDDCWQGDTGDDDYTDPDDPCSFDSDCVEWS